MWIIGSSTLRTGAVLELLTTRASFCAGGIALRIGGWRPTYLVCADRVETFTAGAAGAEEKSPGVDIERAKSQPCCHGRAWALHLGYCSELVGDQV